MSKSAIAHFLFIFLTTPMFMANEIIKPQQQNVGKISLTAPRLFFWRVRAYGKRDIVLGLGGMGAHSTLGNIFSTAT